MLSLWACFCIITPTTILYTAGYRYDFQTHEIKQTGVLSVDILPRDAKVTLNGIVIEKQIPIRLPNRAPGTYVLTIEKPGYKTWSRDIVIESKNTTYVRNITLIKEVLPIKIMDTDNKVVSAKGHNDTILILEKNDELYELRAHNLTNNTETVIYRISSEIAPLLEIRPESSIAYSRIPGTTEDTLYLIPLDKPENASTQNINTSTELIWNPINSTEPLYKKDNKNIYTLSENSRLAGTVSSTVWHIDAQGKIWEMQDKTLTNLYTTETYIFEENIDSIIHINQSRIIATKGDKTLSAKIVDGKIESIETVNGTETRYNNQTGEWLVWSPWELSSIYPDGGVSLLNRSGEKIKRVDILDPSGVLLLSTDAGLSAFNPGYYVRHELLSIEDYTVLSLNTTNRIIYLYGTFAGHTGIHSLEY